MPTDDGAGLAEGGFDGEMVKEGGAVIEPKEDGAAVRPSVGESVPSPGEGVSKSPGVDVGTGSGEVPGKDVGSVGMPGAWAGDSEASSSMGDGSREVVVSDGDGDADGSDGGDV